MKIRKILNNNVIVTKDDEENEIIVMGKGLAFGAKNGDTINESKIDKIFSMKNKQEQSRMEQLMQEIPLDVLELTKICVDYAKVELGKKLDNSIYITLMDHMNTMLERAKLNLYFKNPMLWDIKRLYTEEFQVAEHAVTLINERFHVIFDEHESASIALHIVNAELEMTIEDTINITKVTTEILNVVRYHFNIVYDEESMAYYRFLIHLRFFAKRIFTGKTYADAYDTEFVTLMASKYPESYACMQAVRKYIYDVYGYSFSDEESMYMTIHITKVVQSSQSVKSFSRTPADSQLYNKGGDVRK